MPQAEMHVVTEPTLEERALSIVEDAKLIIVKTGEDYVRAGDFIKLKADPLIEEIKGKYNPRIEQAHTLHKGLIKDRDGFLQQPVEAKSYLRSEMIRYDQEQERFRREEEARLQALARKAEEEAQLAAALEAEAAGQKEEALAILEEEVYVPPVIVKRDVPKVSGVRFTTVWKWRRKNGFDINKVPREWLMLNEVKIGAQIRLWKREGEVIPEIEAYSEKQ